MSVKGSPRIAIIGCGAIAELFYLPALAEYPSVLENSVLVDPNEERVKQLAKAFSAGNYLLDHRDVLSAGIHGVIIATPTYSHYPIAMDFLAKGIHILCEKPLAETADKARDMVEQAQETGATILTNYQRRLYASYIKVKDLLTDGALGEPLSIQYLEGEKYKWPTVSGSRFNTKVSSRGVLLDRGAHVLDLFCWWLDEKPELISSQNDSFGGREALAHVQFKHKRCVGEVRLSLLGKLPCVFKVKCERGTVEGDIYDFQSVIVTKHRKKKRLKLRTKEKQYTDFGHTMVTNFLDIISKGEQPLVSGADVLNSARFIDECYEAASRFNMPWYDVLEMHDDR
jgi:predicted dehydrogenase